MSSLFRGSTKPYHKKAKRSYSKKYRAKQTRNRQESFKKSQRKLSAKLRANPPKSDLWFQELYKQHRHREDLYNHCLGHYIPDLHNPLLKYVVEVDGSYHDSSDIKKKDAKKDRCLRLMGYRVFRVKAYDQASFDSALDAVLQLRKAAGH